MYIIPKIFEISKFLLPVSYHIFNHQEDDDGCQDTNQYTNNSRTCAIEEGAFATQYL